MRYLLSLTLISLSKDTPEDTGPIGLLPLFDGYVLDRQIKTAMQLGTEQIILICPAIEPAILQYVDQLRAKDIDIQTVRSGKDLVQYSSPDNDLLFFADGVLLGDEFHEQLAEAQEETVFVVNDAKEYEQLERIDLNHRWLGVARLNASRLTDFIDLPEDWDVGSALLRGAVQSEVKRQTLTDTSVSDGAVSHLVNKAVTSDYSKDKLRNANFRKGNFLERFLVWPLTKVLLPQLWKAPGAGSYLGWGAVAIAAVACLFAYLGVLTITTFALLLLATLLLEIRSYIPIFSSNIRLLDIVAKAGYSLAVGAVALIIVQDSSPVTVAPNLVIFALLVGTLILTRQKLQRSKSDWIRPDAMLVLLALLISTGFDFFFTGLYSAAILAMLFLLVRDTGNQRTV